MSFGRVLFTPGLLMGASFFQSQQENASSQPKIKVADLPIYDEIPPISDQAYYVETKPTPFLEQKMGELRAATSPYLDEASKVRERISNFYETGKAHSQNALDIMRDESKVLPRAIFVSSGALLGLLFASKKGFIRKLLYTATGAAIPAAVCYPETSKDLIKVGYAHSKDLAANLKTYSTEALSKLSKTEKDSTKVEPSDTKSKQ